MKTKFKVASLALTLVIVTATGVSFISKTGAEEKIYKIGERGPAGGFIFYDKGSNSDDWRYLEAAPEDQSNGSAWGCYLKSIPGAKGITIGTGKSNTAATIQRCRESAIAAKVASNYQGGGKSDWFLPSRDELNLMYQNLKRSGVGGFADVYYWSSSEDNAESAWYQFFVDGKQANGLKTFDLIRVRAIRAY